MCVVKYNITKILSEEIIADTENIIVIYEYQKTDCSKWVCTSEYKSYDWKEIKKRGWIRGD